MKGSAGYCTVHISMVEETKVIYHIDDEDTPYLVKLPVGPDKVTLGDFKNVLNRPNYKFFFKSMDDDFGVVKEEIIEDDCPLPCFNGRVVSWLVSADTSVLSDTGMSETVQAMGVVQFLSVLVVANNYRNGTYYSGRQKICARPSKTMFFTMPITRATDEITKFCKQL